MSKVRVSDQFATNSVTVREAHSDWTKPKVETALHHVNLEKLSVRTESGQGVTLCELPVTGLLVLRAKGAKAALNSALQSALKLELPDVLLSNVAVNESASMPYCVRWIAPDEWLLSCPITEAFDIETTLRASLENLSVAIVNTSGGFTVLELSGPNANDVLKKSTAYDVHPSSLYPGKVVNTVFSKAQVTLRCVDNDHYELLVRRSFADYVWHWIHVASAEYGLSIAVSDA